MAEETKTEEQVEVPTKFKALVESVEKLTVLELAELVKVLEKKFGVSAAAPMAVAAAPVAGGAEAAEEKTSFTVVLAGVGDKKIEVIKVVRDATQKGLKEAKDLVDAAAASPQVVKENAKKEEADDLKKKFEAAGAKVELK
ncbi:MAG: 50S ribosomal protein L7/L12 [Candidatus Wildermuthbacteria bacterium]|nr:50S ribosomal protein L7/L12 [Candidatus Wildermuthbacteria bacterium]